MDKSKFLEDVQKIYDFIGDRKRQLNKLYECLEKNKTDNLEIIDMFADKLGIKPDNNETRLALVTRLVNLRDDDLVQILKKLEYNDEEIIAAQEKAYFFTKEFWLNRHKKTVDFILSNDLLTPFYQELFKGTYEVGIAFSKWQPKWTAYIINGINKELFKEYESDEKVIEFLNENTLYDLGHNDQTADRCYSALAKKGDGYESQAYIKIFKEEVTNTIDKLEEFINRLLELEDNMYNQKWEYVLYLQNIVQALSEDKCNKLVEKWAGVDNAWMQIKTPIQIGHPLEYYEDRYRKAVALEWDIRLSNPSFEKNNKRVEKLRFMFEYIFNSINCNEQKSVYDFSLKSLNKVQLYLGRPALFFGAEFNGLFSAQVVPNDETVSRKEGKKIFAFSDEILQSSRAKPFLKLSREIFGQEFLSEERNFLFKEDANWHKVYDITTIGHEYGHILWCDEETETAMNSSGNFKNIEEFKATAGGLMSFFLDHEEQELSRAVLRDTIKRAVGLIAWKEVDEVQPYYCEGLIHLNGLFSSKILIWEDGNLLINMNEERLEKLKEWYIKTYSSLAVYYLMKKDATLWLNKFAKKEGDRFMPIDENINDFVKHYYNRYKEIGQEIDDQDRKENYVV